MSTIAAARPLTAGPAVGPMRVRWDRVLALLVVVAAAAWFLGGGLVRASQADEPAQPAVTVVVQAGDTVWDLARLHAPAGSSTQDYAMQIVIHNDVTATALRPGTVLELPR